MRPGQREAGRGVIEGRTLPTGGGMAQRAVGWKAHGHVVRIGRFLIVLKMTGAAIGGSADKPSTGVTSCAIQVGMCAGKWVVGKPGVVELRAHPAIHGVADLAGCGEVSDLMGWEGRLHKILCVAGNALRREALELAYCRALVAIVTDQGGVCPHQRKAILVGAH